MAKKRSLHELAVISGTTVGQVRAAIRDGLISESEPTMLDALTIRVVLPVQSMVQFGEKPSVGMFLLVPVSIEHIY